MEGGEMEGWEIKIRGALVWYWLRYVLLNVSLHLGDNLYKSTRSPCFSSSIGLCALKGHFAFSRIFLLYKVKCKQLTYLLVLRWLNH